MKSMSHEIKEDHSEPSSTPKINQVAQSTGHAYQSELFIAQDDLMSLSHRLQSDTHINYPWYKKLKLHVLPLPSLCPTGTLLDKVTSKAYSMRNTSIYVPAMDKAEVICLEQTVKQTVKGTRQYWM